MLLEVFLSIRRLLTNTNKNYIYNINDQSEFSVRLTSIKPDVKQTNEILIHETALWWNESKHIL